MQNEMSFSTLWGSNSQRATAEFTPYQTEQDAKAARDNLYFQLKKQGIKSRRWKINNQIRQYWDMYNPCGHMCNVYKLTILN
jgi:hypothetical protein